MDISDISKVLIHQATRFGSGWAWLVVHDNNLAAFAICGGANPAIAKRINHTPFRIDHGEVDDVVPYILSKKMVDALRDSGAEVVWNLHPGVNHNAWDTVFSDPELLSWLFNHSKK